MKIANICTSLHRDQAMIIAISNAASQTRKKMTVSTKDQTSLFLEPSSAIYTTEHPTTSNLSLALIYDTLVILAHKTTAYKLQNELSDWLELCHRSRTSPVPAMTLSSRTIAYHGSFKTVPRGDTALVLTFLGDARLT